ncbi:mTERF domain-containing protein [Cephalotus follicularis]|uniref:mTERF domain-containing protein n=1 Tax=Cephalotus follicularis TaxID=3775 RepID=A0A1Q3BJN1_CEPFO|nr:mTERF domain-containing protein [Cephalotus follicularis]
MIRLLCSKLLQIRPIASSLNYGYLFSTSSLQTTSQLSNSTGQQSLTLSYLQNSCGLSLESAVSASKKLNIDNTHNPDSVMEFLRTLGLTQAHIKKLIMRRPLFLLADLENTLMPNMELFRSLGMSCSDLVKMINKYPKVIESDAKTVVEFFRVNGFSDEQIASLSIKCPILYLYNADKNVKPKLEYFKSLGFSDVEITNVLSTEPYILERSLENQIMPCIEVLRRLLGNDENVLKAISSCYRLLEFNLEEVLEPNIWRLMKHGVPQSSVLKILVREPKILLIRTKQFNELIAEVKKLGFDPNRFVFLLAIRAMGLVSKTTWDQKLEAYRNFGFSKDDTYSAFKRQPSCMIASEKKIRKLLEFFVNRLNLKPSVISKNSNLMLLSLEKRIIPRCSVLQLLFSKELIKVDISIVYYLRMTEKKFVKRMVRKYQHKVPEVVQAHQGNIQFQGFPIDLSVRV